MRLKSIGIFIIFMFIIGCAKNIPEPNDVLTEDIATLPADTGFANDQNDLEADEYEKETDTDGDDAIVAPIDDPVAEMKFVELFYGRWFNKEQQDIILELEDGHEIVGVRDGELYSESEFIIAEMNIDERFIIIQGISKQYDNYEVTEMDFTSKIILKGDGNEIVYIFDYLGEQFDSEWIKSDD